MNKQAEDLKAIREMMEKSSKFMSFSGLSVVLAGITAIAGAAFAYFYLLKDRLITTEGILLLFADAMIVLILSVAFLTFFSYRKAKKNHQSLFNKVTLRVAYNLCIPLFAGGIYCLVFLLRGNIEMVISGTLLFYGLALINASKYTYDEIHYLGITEIVLGLAATIFLYKGMFFWTIGFGLCHIIFGLIIYVKYDRKKA